MLWQYARRHSIVIAIVGMTGSCVTVPALTSQDLAPDAPLFEVSDAPMCQGFKTLLEVHCDDGVDGGLQCSDFAKGTGDPFALYEEVCEDRCPTTDIPHVLGRCRIHPDAGATGTLLVCNYICTMLIP